jgi:glycosyltransferase involved in cell wall biosynthesis
MLGHVRALAELLPAHGWEPEVAAPAGTIPSTSIALSGMSRPGPAMLADRRALRHAAARVDVIHAHGLTMGWLSASLRARPPLVVTVHNVVLADRRPQKLLRGLERRIARVADRTIATAPDVADRLDGSSVRTIWPVRPPGRAPTEDPVTVRRRYGVPTDAPLIVSIGRLHPQKDIDTLLAALQALRRRIPEVRALLVGEGPEDRRLRAETARRGLDDAVVFAGWSDNPADEMAAADVVAVSSRWESGPFVIPEALALGTPVVSTAVGWSPRILDPSHVVPWGSARLLAEAIEAVLADRARAAGIASAEAERAERLLEPHGLVSEVVSVYEEIRRR